MTELVPAILTNDISDFRKKYAELFALSHYFSKLHIDFADGQFVPSKTIDPNDLMFLKSPLTLMAHFMTFNPKRYFVDAKRSGFEWVLFHFEACADDAEVLETIKQAKEFGLKVGLVLNPETELFKPSKFFDQVGLIQLMGIHPGEQGREFMPQTIEKIKELKKLTKNVIIAVDGGIRVGIAKQCAQAGADMLVAGSAILRAENEEEAIEALEEDIKS